MRCSAYNFNVIIWLSESPKFKKLVFSDFYLKNSGLQYFQNTFAVTDTFSIDDQCKTFPDIVQDLDKINKVLSINYVIK